MKQDCKEFQNLINKVSGIFEKLRKYKFGDDKSIQNEISKLMPEKEKAFTIDCDIGLKTFSTLTICNFLIVFYVYKFLTYRFVNNIKNSNFMKVFKSYLKKIGLNDNNDFKFKFSVLFEHMKKLKCPYGRSAFTKTLQAWINNINLEDLINQNKYGKYDFIFDKNVKNFYEKISTPNEPALSIS